MLAKTQQLEGNKESSCAALGDIENPLENSQHKPKTDTNIQ